MGGWDNGSDIAVERWLLEYARRRSCADSGRVGEDVSLWELRERIASAMAPLVQACARRYRSMGSDVGEDLVQEGYLGLLAALDHWDPGRGVKFGTYATHFVVGSMRHFLRDRNRPIREPMRVTAVARRVDSAVASLVQQLGRSPRSDEIAAALALSEEAVDEALVARDRSTLVSTATFEEEWDTADDGVPVARFVEDRDFFERALSLLRPREQEVLYEHFFRELTQSEIARKLGVSANYVSVTLRRGTERLRRIWTENDRVARERLREERLIDTETGLYCRKQTHARLLEGVSVAARESGMFGVVAVRLLGIGDARDRVALLGRCGAMLRRSIRRSDIGGRWDAETLVALLPGTGETSTVVAGRLSMRLGEEIAGRGALVAVLPRTFWYPEHGARASEIVGHLDAFCAGNSSVRPKVAA